MEDAMQLHLFLDDVLLLGISDAAELTRLDGE